MALVNMTILRNVNKPQKHILKSMNKVTTVKNHFEVQLKWENKD